ncbi:uncharacterized protein LOC115886473 isoform X2 [Sitophilus oryzae]|uniref:Uncharacterized protein LOC115886473 isoform X2 n=1 Tax=Sitophilus oryzae TaxID=7048 RepID=A0A6J2YF36_SITOR|nr:uncharacterized protein LOC115886473 isoform X2 [Sitophilus oryzae]
MQSKLPVRVNKRHILEKRECQCAKLFESMLKDPSDGICSFCLQKVNQYKKKSTTKPTKGNLIETLFKNQQNSIVEIKQILLCINSTLEAILIILKERKEELYHKLKENNVKLKTSTSCHKQDNRKSSNQLVKTQPYRWPDISRLYSEPPLWINNCVGRFITRPNTEERKILLYPLDNNILYINKPFSCPNIGYFQNMKNLYARKISMSMYSIPIFTIKGRHPERKQHYETQNKEIIKLK